jgi:glycine dehydrogenase subunit 1
MDFISNKEKQIKEMLEAIGVKDVKELFSSVPENLLCPRSEKEDGLSEMEGIRLMEEIASKNVYPSYDSYLGAGAYEHYVPALVDALCSRSEFLTAYTPYQAEASQGMLQAIFEYQSAVSAMTGMEVANASVYDGSSACAEALLMAMRVKKKAKRIVIAESLHPHYRAVVEQYLSSFPIEIVSIPCDKSGVIDQASADKLINEDTAAVLIQSPNFYGVVDELDSLIAKAKSCGALVVICADLLAYGLYKSAGELGADIAVGDSQSFGLPLQYGGPYAGYMACKKELVRQMPGRIVGKTLDTKGREGYVLTLQAREQHIRREKATSNICSNQNLAALAALFAILWYGKEGVRKLALSNYRRTAYLKRNLGELKGIKILSTAPVFNEFILDFGLEPEKIHRVFNQEKIAPGVDLGKIDPKREGQFLVAVTETKTQEQLDHYISVAKEILS